MRQLCRILAPNVGNGCRMPSRERCRVFQTVWFFGHCLIYRTGCLFFWTLSGFSDSGLKSASIAISPWHVRIYVVVVYFGWRDETLAALTSRAIPKPGRPRNAGLALARQPKARGRKRPRGKTRNPPLRMARRAKRNRHCELCASPRATLRRMGLDKQGHARRGWQAVPIGPRQGMPEPSSTGSLLRVRRGTLGCNAAPSRAGRHASTPQSKLKAVR